MYWSYRYLSVGFGCFSIHKQVSNQIMRYDNICTMINNTDNTCSSRSTKFCCTYTALLGSENETFAFRKRAPFDISIPWLLHLDESGTPSVHGICTPTQNGSRNYGEKPQKRTTPRNGRCIQCLRGETGLWTDLCLPEDLIHPYEQQEQLLHGCWLDFLRELWTLQKNSRCFSIPHWTLNGVMLCSAPSGESVTTNVLRNALILAKLGRFYRRIR